MSRCSGGSMIGRALSAVTVPLAVSARFDLGQSGLQAGRAVTIAIGITTIVETKA
jgi:hypothetical protein